MSTIIAALLIYWQYSRYVINIIVIITCELLYCVVVISYRSNRSGASPLLSEVQRFELTP